jgi:hypothetical protein
MEKVDAFRCSICGKVYDREQDACECEFKHKQEIYANCLLDKGFNLGYINYMCGYHWSLTDEQEKITKDNCFIISHWQCCNKPAYRITYIEGNFVMVRGCGSWDGYYGNLISPDKLPKPHPKEELFVDERYMKQFIDS